MFLRKSLFKVCVGLFLAIGCYCLSFGQEPLSLADAIQIGLENNYQIQIAERDLEIAKNNNDWAIAGRYPNIDLSVNFNNNYNNINNPISFIPEISSFNTGITPGMQASWILFDGYRVRFTKSQLEELENRSNGNARLAVENAIQSVILAYYNALIQKEQLDVLEEVLQLSRDRIDYQNIRKEFGQSGTFDLLQAQDAYFNDSTTYLIQQNTYETALRNLNLAMGQDELNSVYTLADTLIYEPQTYDWEALETKMLANNQSLRNLFIDRELAGINTRINEAANYPTISTNAGMAYTYSLATGSGTTNDGEERTLNVNQKTFNGFINFTATYNLFDFGVRKRRIENAKVEEMIAQLNVEDLKRNLRNQLANTLATYNNQKDLVLLTNNLLENARQNLEITEERFRGGLINSFDYRTVQLNYINASQSRLNAVFNLKNTETELIRLIGGLVMTK